MLLLFLAAQCFDGLFTYAAVHAYGPHAEGNILIATWISLVGPAAALFGAKTVAAPAACCSTCAACTARSRSSRWSTASARSAPGSSCFTH